MWKFAALVLSFALGFIVGNGVARADEAARLISDNGQWMADGLREMSKIFDQSR